MGYLGGIFLLFLLFCAITSCIHPVKISIEYTISREDITPGTEDAITSTEDTIYTEDIISTENTISTEDTIPWAEDTLICKAVIDGDTIKLETGETVRLIGIGAPELYP